MYYYYDTGFPQNDVWGDTHYVPGGYDPWAQIDITQGAFPLNNAGGQLTITLIHEAVHGMYGIDDRGDQPEQIANRCYRP